MTTNEVYDFEIHDDRRVLRFNGEELASSSSRQRNSPRWIEFTLYRTTEGRQYILERLGPSNVVHTPECRFTKRNSLTAYPWKTVLADNPEAIDCVECKPSNSGFPLVCPEEDKSWARVYRTPAALYKALLKTDESGNQYLTGVARRLIERAAVKDPDLRNLETVEDII